MKLGLHTIMSKCMFCGTTIAISVVDGAPKEAFIHAGREVKWKAMHHCDYWDPLEKRMRTPSLLDIIKKNDIRGFTEKDITG